MGYSYYPPQASGGSGVATYANFASLPASATDGTLAVTLDTHSLYVFNGTLNAWVLDATGGTTPNTVGSMDSVALSTNGAVIGTNSLFMQSASFSNPGLVNSTTQTFGGIKNFALQATSFTPPTNTQIQITPVDGSHARIVMDATGSASAANISSGLFLRRAQGTTASPSGVLADNNLGFVGASGYGTTGFGSQTAATITFRASQNWTDANQGAYMVFNLNANSTNTAVERLRINQDGTYQMSAYATPIAGGGVLTVGSGGTVTQTNTLSINSGSVTAPGLYFNSQPSSGFYLANSADICVALGGTKAFEILQVGSVTSFGFGGAASTGVLNPLSAYSNVNGQANFNYSNYNQGLSAQTILYVGAGATGGNGITVENHGFSNEAYTGGGGLLSASANLSFLNICSENGSGYITFNVFGRSLATERMRLTSTALTMNGGTQLIMVGSSVGAAAVTIQATTSTSSSYTLTLPATPGFANQVLVTSSGTTQVLSYATAVIGSASTTQIQPLAQLTVGSVTLTSSTGGQVYKTILPGTFGTSGQVLTTAGSGSSQTYWGPGLSSILTTSGDMVISSGSGNAFRLPVGSGGKTLTVSTSSLVPSWISNVPTKQIFTALGSNSYFTPANCLFIKVTVVGGGGGGGGGAAAAASSTAGAGGGGGGVAVKWLSPTPLQVYALTVGAGGPGGVAGNNAGQAGSQSSFAITVIAAGGSGGSGGAAQAALTVEQSSGGAGGGGSGGDFNLTGQAGGVGIVYGSNQAVAGNGGGSSLLFGPGGIGQGNTTATGTAGGIYGGGGAGGVAITNSSQAGGAGAQGIIICEEFYA